MFNDFSVWAKGYKIRKLRKCEGVKPLFVFCEVFLTVVRRGCTDVRVR